jgi:hypothetical protein
MGLLHSFAELVQPLSPVMTAPTFSNFTVLLAAWLFAQRRTLTQCWLVAPRARRKSFCSFHRFFAHARWSLEELGLSVFELLLPCLGNETIFLALDDTLARKRGTKMYGVGMHHDPLASSRQKAITSWGHSWVVLGVLVRWPFAPHRWWCLPILFALYRSRQTVEREGGVHRSRPQLAVQLLEILCDRFPQRRFHVLADSTYGGHSVLAHLPVNCDLTSRLLLNARLYESAPPRPKGRNGRPRTRGALLPTPAAMLQQRAKRQTLTLYGRHDKVRFVTQVGCVHAVPQRRLRIVAVEALRGGRGAQAFYSTVEDSTAEQILEWYARRWAIEQTFQESKTHLGFEQPQNWTKRAVQRTAPVAMLLYSLVVLWFARNASPTWRAPRLPWYRSKRHPSFADMLSEIRRQSVQQEVLKSAATTRPLKNPLKKLLPALGITP